MLTKISGIVLPGMAAGWIHEQVSQWHIWGTEAQGYINYFWLVMLCSVSTYIVCAMVKVAPDFGKATNAAQRS